MRVLTLDSSSTFVHPIINPFDPYLQTLSSSSSLSAIILSLNPFRKVNM